MRKMQLTLLILAIAAMMFLAGCDLLGGGGTSTAPAPIPTASDPDALYAGSAACAACHEDQFSDFEKSGHPFKLNKVVNDSVPTYPYGPGIENILETLVGDAGGSTRIDKADDDAALASNGTETDNVLGTPDSYADVSYVIGGYGWKARWIDADGYIVTGSSVQYNLADGSMAGYHDGEANKAYNCGNCHTTGWRRYNADLNTNRQDDLPGMDGTFVAGGVQCESCHGPGNAHVASQDKDDIVLLATGRTAADFANDDMGYSKATACGECHTRDGEHDYPTYVSAYEAASDQTDKLGGRINASGGLGKHHQQFDELLGIDPDGDLTVPLGKHLIAGVTCVTCHDSHKTTKRQAEAGVTGLKATCDSCHGTGKAEEITMPVDSFMADFDCADCHMPNLTKSAIKHAAVGTGPATGDIATHIFKIDLAKADQITDDGKFVNPWLTKDFACGTCHNGVDAFDISASDYTGYTFHKAAVAADTSAFTGKYAGSAVCGECHATYYTDFIQSGHPYKLNKVKNDSVPTYPFSDISAGLPLVTDAGGSTRIDKTDGDAALPSNGTETDNELGTPGSYADVSYVIGGYGWKARWIDADGYIVTGSSVQYNLADGSMAGYHDGDANKVYNCGNCHTTGWARYDIGDNPNRQDDLPGMEGTFVLEGGVQCESCHGAALEHVVTQDTAKVTKTATGRTTADFLAADMAFNLPVACGECHTRDGEHDYPTYVSAYETASGETDFLGGRINASGGFGRHHQQKDELLGIDPEDIGSGPQGPHRTRSCVTCHDPHATTKYRDDPANTSSTPGVAATVCNDCHINKTFTLAIHEAKECIDCHMPKSTKSAITTDGANGADTFGDIRSHIYKIDLASVKQFTDDGKFMIPRLGPAFACGACHADADAARAARLPGGKVHP